jgi:hypothetical protein
MVKNFLINFIKQRISTLIILIIFASLLAWGVVSINAAKNAAVRAAELVYTGPPANVNLEDEGSYEDIAESGVLTLRYNKAKGSIQVVDNTNGYIWKSIADDELYDTSSLNAQWASYLKSVLTVSYNNVAKRDAPPAKVFSGAGCDYLEAEYIENGVAVVYGFTTQGFFITVEYTLEDGEFVVRVPADKIQETLNFAITTIELMPYFGAAGDDVKGYMLYPDGSGGIPRYERADSRPSNVKVGLWYTYSDQKTDILSFFDPDIYQRYTASMPVYGVKNNDNAFLAAFTHGAEEAGIAAYPSGYVVRLNHIGFEIYTRNIFDVDMSNISVDSTTQQGKKVQRVDRNIISRDREIRYFMLSGEDANYSKMAAVYRDYLIETDQLSPDGTNDTDFPLALGFTMGALETQMLMDSFIPMTTFDQLTGIFDRLKANGVNSVKAVLTAWLKDAYAQPRYWPPASQLGGTDGMEALDAYLAANPGYDVYFENNFIYAEKESGDFSTIADVVYNGTNIPVTFGYDTTWYLLNPKVSLERNRGFLERMQAYPQLNVSYEDEGSVVYTDYNKRAPFAKWQTVETWRSLFADTAASGRKVGINGMNQYAFRSADYLYDVPLKAFGLSITDDSVPFAQMVVSGLIPYSSGAGNLSYDLEIQKLKWIEYGALPYFHITHEDSIKLKNTGANSLFTSTYDKWEDRMLTVYNELAENFADVYGRQMVSHEVLEKDLIRVGYDNGTLVYINYSSAAKSADGVSIAPQNYTLVKDGM